MDIKIAEFIIRISSSIKFQLEEGYNPFIIEKSEQKPDVYVDCFTKIPDHLLEMNSAVFEAKNKHQQFYSIFRKNDNLIFKIYDQQNNNSIQQIAILNKDFSKWKIYFNLEIYQSFYPLKYPMGQILMYYLTVNNNAIMLHASGIYDGEKGRIFSGFSGAGKSTISEIWKESGSMIINDDRLIIRKIDGKFRMFNTPMYYDDIPKQAKVDSIHIISHSNNNKSKLISGAKAISSVLAFCIQNNFDKQLIENNLNFIYELCHNTTVYETGFLPDKKIVEFIRNNEK